MGVRLLVTEASGSVGQAITERLFLYRKTTLSACTLLSTPTTGGGVSPASGLYSFTFL